MRRAFFSVRATLKVLGVGSTPKYGAPLRGRTGSNTITVLTVILLNYGVFYLISIVEGNRKNRYVE